MMMMTAKVDMKKIVLVLAGIAAAILILVLLFGGSEDTAAPVVSDNDSRVKFLEEYGWQVSASPQESSQVKIPETMTPAYERYNALQKSQGYDLSQYAGQTVMRYVYKINNYPGATAPVYATILVYKNQIIGGDVTNTAPGGVIQGFRMPRAEKQPATESTTEPVTEPVTEPTSVNSTES